MADDIIYDDFVDIVIANGAEDSRNTGIITVKPTATYVGTGKAEKHTTASFQGHDVICANPTKTCAVCSISMVTAYKAAMTIIKEVARPTAAYL